MRSARPLSGFSGGAPTCRRSELRAGECRFQEQRVVGDDDLAGEAHEVRRGEGGPCLATGDVQVGREGRPDEIDVALGTAPEQVEGQRAFGLEIDVHARRGRGRGDGRGEDLVGIVEDRDGLALAAGSRQEGDEDKKAGSHEPSLGALVVAVKRPGSIGSLGGARRRCWGVVGGGVGEIQAGGGGGGATGSTCTSMPPIQPATAL